MNIYKITTDVKFVDYDTYDSAVVVANSEEEARVTNNIDGNSNMQLFWVQPLNDLKIELIGTADKSFTKPCVLVASFNAG